MTMLMHIPQLSLILSSWFRVLDLNLNAKVEVI